MLVVTIKLIKSFECAGKYINSNRKVLQADSMKKIRKEEKNFELMNEIIIDII